MIKSNFRGKGLESCIGPWVLFEDVGWSKEKQIVVKKFQFKVS